MPKFDKNALSNKIRSSSHHASADIDARLDRAEALVKKQPTGFSEVVEPDVPLSNQPLAFTRENASGGAHAVYFARVPIEEIDPNPFNARQIYHPERVKEMATSILASGVLVWVVSFSVPG